MNGRTVGTSSPNLLRPSKPVEDAFAESLNARLFDEFLNVKLVHEHKTCQGGHGMLAAGLK